MPQMPRSYAEQFNNNNISQNQLLAAKKKEEGVLGVRYLEYSQARQKLAQALILKKAIKDMRGELLIELYSVPAVVHKSLWNLCDAMCKSERYDYNAVLNEIYKFIDKNNWLKGNAAKYKRIAKDALDEGLNAEKNKRGLDQPLKAGAPFAAISTLDQRFRAAINKLLDAETTSKAEEEQCMYLLSLSESKLVHFCLYSTKTIKASYASSVKELLQIHSSNLSLAFLGKATATKFVSYSSVQPVSLNPISTKKSTTQVVVESVKPKNETIKPLPQPEKTQEKPGSWLSAQLVSIVNWIKDKKEAFGSFFSTKQKVVVVPSDEHCDVTYLDEQQQGGQQFSGAYLSSEKMLNSHQKIVYEKVSTANLSAPAPQKSWQINLINQEFNGQISLSESDAPLPPETPGDKGYITNFSVEKHFAEKCARDERSKENNQNIVVSPGNNAFSVFANQRQADNSGQAQAVYNPNVRLG